MFEDISEWYLDSWLLGALRADNGWEVWRSLCWGANPRAHDGLPVLEAVRRRRFGAIMEMEWKGGRDCLDARSGLPLILALARKDKEMVQYLLGKHASPETGVFGKGMDGRFEEAMAVARACGHLPMEGFLKERGAVEPRAKVSMDEIRDKVLNFREEGPKAPLGSLALAFTLAAALTAGSVWALWSPEDKSAPAKPKAVQAEAMPKPMPK